MTERICRIYTPEQFDLAAGSTLRELLADYDLIEVDGRPDLRGNGDRPLEGAEVLWVRGHPDDSGRVLVAAEVPIDLPEVIAEAGGISVVDAEQLLQRHLPEVRAHLLASYGAELSGVRCGCVRFWTTFSSELSVGCLTREVADRSMVASMWEQGGCGRRGVPRAVGACVLEFIERHCVTERGFLATIRHQQRAPAWPRR